MNRSSGPTTYKDAGMVRIVPDSTCRASELRHKGWGADVERAAQLNLYDTLPVMRQERLEPFRP